MRSCSAIRALSDSSCFLVEVAPFAAVAGLAPPAVVAGAVFAGADLAGAVLAGAFRVEPAPVAAGIEVGFAAPVAELFDVC